MYGQLQILKESVFYLPFGQQISLFNSHSDQDHALLDVRGKPLTVYPETPETPPARQECPSPYEPFR